MDENKKITLNFIDLIPKGWLDASGSAKLLMSTYTCLVQIKFNEKEPFVFGDIGNARYVIFEGSFKYLDTTFQFKEIKDGMPKFDVNVTEIEAPATCYIIIFAINDQLALQNVEVAKGLICALEGFNATYTHVNDQTIELPEKKPTFAAQ